MVFVKMIFLHGIVGFGEYPVAQHSIQKRAVAEEPTIVVVDDDNDFRASLGDLFNSVGFKVKMFGSAAELLQGELLPDAVSCLVLDVRLPGLGGLMSKPSCRK